jgi:hypothetical protein
MRALFILLVGVALGACGHDALPGPGGGGGSGGGDMAGGIAVDMATPGGGGPHVCTGSCNACSSGGVCCGGVCCPSGEWCDTTTMTCRCGEHPTCKSGQFCAAGGPIGNPGTCGIVCCGAGVPCPL